MKKIISFILAIMMCASMTVVSFAQVPDVEPYATVDDLVLPQSERAVLHDAAWFYNLRTTYLNYDSHYTKNTELESGMGYIYGQGKCPQFYIGTSRMASVGCEIAAVYNAIKHRGFTVSCSEIIKTFEKKGYLMGVGYLGSDPFAIDDYFETSMSYQLTKYTSFSSFNSRVTSNISSRNVYIVSYWNTDDFTDGLHTVCFYTIENGSKLYVYNATTNSTKVAEKSSLLSLIKDDERFIVGYFVPRMGRMIG